MIFNTGDIVEIFSPIAGKKKYHLFIIRHDDKEVSCFFFFNSKPGFEGEMDINPEDVPCLPESKTGESVICFNTIIRHNDKQLELYKAKVLGRLPDDRLASLLEKACVERSLNKKEQALVKLAKDEWFDASD